TEDEVLAEAGKRLEIRLAALASDVQQQARWQAAISSAEINGWLASKLYERFPELPPDQMADPRVALGENALLVGFRYRGARFETTVSLEVDVFVAEEGLVAVRFRRASAGSLPLPLREVIEQANVLAARFGYALRWTRHEGDPVACVPLRDVVASPAERRKLESIELREGEILLAGVTLSDGLPSTDDPMSASSTDAATPADRGDEGESLHR
ncbi:MAG: hypothetical protein AAF961_01595, partial [Planctomycetota bacterium]